MVFTAKGLIAKVFCGHKEPKWCLFQHNTKELIKVYDSFENCIENVYHTDTIQGSRQPTCFELKQGYGATHYRDFSILEWVKPNGQLKAWIKADDGLRYYR